VGDGIITTRLGDVDADGHADLLIGTPGYRGAVGAAYLGTWAALW